MRKYICPDCQDPITEDDGICRICNRSANSVKCRDCESWSDLMETENCANCNGFLKEIFVIPDVTMAETGEKLIEEKYKPLSDCEYGLLVSDEKPNLSGTHLPPLTELEKAYEAFGYLKDTVKIGNKSYFVMESPNKKADEKYPLLINLWNNLGNFEKIKYLKQLFIFGESLHRLNVTGTLLKNGIFVKRNSIFIFPFKGIKKDNISVKEALNELKDYLHSSFVETDLIIHRIIDERRAESFEDMYEYLDEIRENLESRYEICSFGLSDLGPVRENNEDDFFCVDFCFSQPDKLHISGRGLKQRGLYILCDGMGGHQKGEVASALMVREMRKKLLPLLLEEIPHNAFEDMLRHIIRDANDIILEVNIHEKISSNEGRMGTTVVAAIAYENEVFVAHVGDSRCYKYCNGELTRLTEDHNLAMQAFHAGTFKTREEAEKMRGGKVLTQAIGPREGQYLNTSIKRDLFRGDGYLLLCSDGLTDAVNDDEIKKILEDGKGNLRRMCRQLTMKAYLNHTRDNISVILASFRQKI